MATLIDGKAVAKRIRAEITAEAERLPRKPGLAVILVGEDPASCVYVRNKEKDCAECGFASREYRMPDTATEAELLSLINRLNGDGTVDGILVQLPLPAHIDERRVIEAIAPDKDVDAFHPVNVGRMTAGVPSLLPCTPAGIMELLRAYDIDPAGKTCVVVSRSNIVGKPMGILLLRAHGTVIFCHSRTKDLAAMTRQADILITAAGQRGLITEDMIKEGAAVVDVAMNRDPDTGKFTGDVRFEEVERKASFISPVPGGVGPMTRAILMRNILTAAKEHMGIA